MLKIGIAGISGRMGREIVAAAETHDDLTVVGGYDGPGSSRIIAPSAAEPNADLLRLVDVLIDFSNPNAVGDYVHACAAASLPYVCGVTGLRADHLQAMREAATVIPVFYGRNMSVGIAAVLAFLPELAARLSDYDVEIVELHHRRKVDAPSGTALALGEAAAAGRGVSLEAAAIHGRTGHSPRQVGEIGIHALRGGGNAGEHTVLFAGDNEEIRIAHRALSRRTFADGALRAARFTAAQPPGFYQMADLLK